MGYFVEEEEQKYRKLFAPLAIGGVLFLLGFLIVLFGRPYGFEGTNYDLFLVFGVLFLVIGGIVAGIPLVLQLRMLYKGLKRKDEGPMSAYAPVQSAAGQMMRNTQIFSSAPPSTYDGGHRQQIATGPVAQPHQFSAAAAFNSGSMDKLKQSQTSLNQPAPQQAQSATFPPSYDQATSVPQPQTKRQYQTQPQPQYQTQPQPKPQPQPQYQPQPQPQYQRQPQPQYQTQPQPQPQPQPQYQPQPQPQYRQEPQPQHRQEPQPQYRQEPQPEYRQEPQPQYRQEPQPQHRQEPQPQHRQESQAQPQYAPRQGPPTGPPVPAPKPRNPQPYVSHSSDI